MPLYKPSELRTFLDSLNIRPKKGLSQNFLIDGNIIRKIVDAAQLEKEDVVLEIGPGPGALTEMLLEKGVHVVAVEKDKILANALERLREPDKRLDVFCEDILEFPLEKLKEFLKEGQKVKVIANLPYHVTTPILAHLISHHTLFSRLIIMVQDEVARRFIALPKTSDYSSLTIFLHFFSQPKYLFMVSEQCFYPVPKVKSAVVALDLKEPCDVSDREKFFLTVRTAFMHRRKMLRASLRDLYGSEHIVKALESLQYNPQARPEELSLREWLQFFEALQ